MNQKNLCHCVDATKYKSNCKLVA